MPQKPVKCGIKFYEFCDSHSGYCKNIYSYKGEDDNERNQGGKMGRIVLDLVRGLENANHHCYKDNNYTSPILFILLKHGNVYHWNCQSKSRLPKAALEAVRLTEQGHRAWVTYENFMLELRWKDKMGTFLMSIIHSSPEEIPTPSSNSSDFKHCDGTWKSKKVACPIPVKDYNKHMGGVALCNKMTVLNKSIKQLRWYLQILLMLVMISIHVFILESYAFDH